MAMQVKILVLFAVLAVSGPAPSAATDRHEDRPNDSGRHGRPGIIIEPYIDLSRRQRPNVDAPEFIMAEISRCTAAGIRLFVDCLRQNHGSVMIRRLEACVSSESIPDDPRRVEVCLPMVGQP